jgi:ATP-dependent Lon protease
MANVDIKEEREVEIPTMLPVLPVRDMVIFPYMILPLFVGRDVSIKAIDHALSGNKMILLVTQKDLNVEEPTIEDLYEVGTVSSIHRLIHSISEKLKKYMIRRFPRLPLRTKPLCGMSRTRWINQ